MAGTKPESRSCFSDGSFIELLGSPRVFIHDINTLPGFEKIIPQVDGIEKYDRATAVARPQDVVIVKTPPEKDYLQWLYEVRLGTKNIVVLQGQFHEIGRGHCPQLGGRMPVGSQGGGGGHLPQAGQIVLEEIPDGRHPHGRATTFRVWFPGLPPGDASLQLPSPIKARGAGGPVAFRTVQPLHKPPGNCGHKALQVPVSWFLERFKAIPTFLAGLFITAVGLMILGLASIYAASLVFLGIFVFAVGEMVSSPRIQEYITWIAPKDKAGLYMGTNFVATAIGAGPLANIATPRAT